MNHSVRQSRIRRLRKWRKGILEQLAWLLGYVIAMVVFFYLPLAQSMGW
jgi:hypothetical protein